MQHHTIGSKKTRHLSVRVLAFILIWAVLLFLGCGTLFLVDKKCFDISDELKLFPGNVGNTITFISSKGLDRILKISKKYADHITGYTTDTGCSCYDYWNVQLSDNSLTISFSTSLQYLANSEGTRMEDIIVLNSMAVDTFTEKNKTIHESLSISGQTLQTVLEYSKVTTYQSHVKAIYFAKNIGLAMIVFGDGDTLTNSNLSTSTVTGTETWDYDEQRCE